MGLCVLHGALCRKLEGHVVERGEMMVIMVTLALQEAFVLLRGALRSLLSFDVRLTGAASERKAECVALARRLVLVGTALRSVPTAAACVRIVLGAVHQSAGAGEELVDSAEGGVVRWGVVSGDVACGGGDTGGSVLHTRSLHRCAGSTPLAGKYVHDAVDAALSHKTHAAWPKPECNRHSRRGDGRSGMQSINGTAGKYTKGGRGEGVYVLGRDAVVGSRALGTTVCWVLRTLTLHYLRVVAMYAAAAGAVMYHAGGVLHHLTADAEGREGGGR